LIKSIKSFSKGFVRSVPSVPQPDTHDSPGCAGKISDYNIPYISTIIERIEKTIYNIPYYCVAYPTIACILP